MTYLIANQIVGIIGIAALGCLIYGTVKYLASGKDQIKAKKGKRLIRPAIIVILLLLVYFAIVNFNTPMM